MALNWMLALQLAALVVALRGVKWTLAQPQPQGGGACRERALDLAKFEQSNVPQVFERMFATWTSGSSSSLLAKLFSSANAESERLLKTLAAARAEYARGELDADTRAQLADGGEQQLDLALMVELLDVTSGCLALDATAPQAERESWCSSKTAARNLAALLKLFAQTSASKPLFAMLHDKLLDLGEWCKPLWDEQLLQLVDVQLDEETRLKMMQLFDNVISIDERIKSGIHTNDHSQRDDERVKLITLRLFKQLAAATPKPSAVLLFMWRHNADEFALDANMHNARLSSKLFERAVNRLVVATCSKARATLAPTAAFYMEVLYQNAQLDQKQVLMRLFLKNNNKRANQWLLSDAICGHLLNEREADKLYKKIYRAITAGGGGGAASEPPERAAAAAAAPDSGRQQRTMFDELDAEFNKNRHELFLKENGF